LGQAFIARSSSKKKEQEEVLNNEIDHVENGNK
jgi:demethoxyubiquinone hydroxylase (CLK1/Coq7/Cat5 family)